MVAFGYQASVVSALARGGVGAPPPRFELERLREYLLAGLRMFVVSIVLTLLVTPICFVVLFVGNLAGAVLFGQQSAVASALGCVVVAAEVLLFIAVMVVGMALVTPLLVRAALVSDLAATFDLGFVRDFLARTWREVVIGHLVLLLINLALFVVGALACFVGIFPALAYGLLVQAHVFGQLYLLYLQRGGRAIG